MKFCQFFLPIKNHHGNALIGVLVAGTISAIIGAGTYAMISSQIRAQKLVGASSEKTILRAQIQGILGNSELCAKTLKDSDGKVAKYNPDSVLPPKPSAMEKAAFEKQNSLSNIAIASSTWGERILVLRRPCRLLPLNFLFSSSSTMLRALINLRF